MIVRATSRKDIEQACVLLNTYAGGIHDVDEYYDKDDVAVFVVYYERLYDSPILGAAIASRLDVEDMKDLDSYFLSEFERTDDLTWIESIAVLPFIRGKGFGKRLTLECIKHCLTLSNKILALCWESNLERQSLILFKDLGFEEVEHFKHPWLGEDCPVCITDCHCDATLVYKEY